MTQDSFTLARKLRQIIDFFGYSEAEILEIAGFESSFFEKNTERLSKDDIKSLLIAFKRSDEGQPLRLEKTVAFARAATTPATIAFSSSANVAEGLKRFTLLKPQEFPIDIDFRFDETGCKLDFQIFGAQTFAKYELLEAVFIAELIRTYTGKSDTIFPQQSLIRSRVLRPI